jgi:cytochrome c oxidase subunit III
VRGSRKESDQQLAAAQADVVSAGPLLDVSALPSFAFSHRSLMWWGTLGMIAIEGTLFVLAVVAYFYLRHNAPMWPPNEPPPELLWGTVNTVILVVSMWPNHWTKQVAEKLDLPKIRIGLVVCLIFSAAFLAVRVLEFRHLNTGWDHTAYGSVVWVLLGLHTVHLIADTWDSAVLTVLMFTGPLEGKRYVDVSENGVYWYFVVLAWLPIYAVIYWVPRWP